jgi:ring-1,2-phenylacetyl-CoA epoxidase subunit PaaB
MQFLRKYFYGDYDAMQGGGTPPLTPPTGEHPTPPGRLNEEVAKNAGSLKSGPGAEGSYPVGGAGTAGAEWPLWEVFVRSKQGLDHKHVGSLHAADAKMAIENGRDVYTRRQEGISIWVVESKHIHASNPDEAESFYEPAADKVYRHPTFYNLPDSLTHM